MRARKRIHFIPNYFNNNTNTNTNNNNNNLIDYYKGYKKTPMYNM